MNKSVLVTGANGMLATNIIEGLARAGYRVIGTVRKGKSYKGEKTPDINIVEADFKDEESMAPLVARCDIIFHVAAMTSQSEKNYEVFRKVNVDSTKMLLDLSVASGIDTFVYVSTANTIGYGGAEEAEMKYPFTESFYAMSKKEAEDAAISYSDRMKVVVVNPTFMVGKYGTDKGSNRIFSMVRKSAVVFCPSGGKNVIDVSEAARGMILAMEKGQTGSRYLICGRNYHFIELFRKIASEYGVRRLFVRVPGFLLRLAGHLGDLLARCGIASEVSTVNISMLLADNFYTTDKAERELGFKPHDLFGK